MTSALPLVSFPLIGSSVGWSSEVVSYLPCTEASGEKLPKLCGIVVDHGASLEQRLGCPVWARLPCLGMALKSMHEAHQLRLPALGGLEGGLGLDFHPLYHFGASTSMPKIGPKSKFPRTMPRQNLSYHVVLGTRV